MAKADNRKDGCVGRQMAWVSIVVSSSLLLVAVLAMAAFAEDIVHEINDFRISDVEGNLLVSGVFTIAVAAVVVAIDKAVIVIREHPKR